VTVSPHRVDTTCMVWASSDGNTVDSRVPGKEMVSGRPQSHNGEDPALREYR
jgi:hypothetical protein